MGSMPDERANRKQTHYRKKVSLDSAFTLIGGIAILPSRRVGTMHPPAVKNLSARNQETHAPRPGRGKRHRHVGHPL
jgi:hypothetical protein